eukprot:TRINITY_DN12970_c0_g2_i1.p1 TRINITY_DN12970_c0_g2~~TRINITY_DN12970_c0_g2_i1.p1  ORF type:complete len:840 (-),score=176.78 TRINITY_DN12970_c0_g2_i1:460-2895(-)
MPSYKSTGDDFDLVSWNELMSRSWGSVIVMLMPVLILIIGLYILHQFWQANQSELAEATGVMNDTHAFAKHLVQHFMPSFKVSKYQFRGMQQHESMVNVAFQDLSLELPGGPVLLKGVTGDFQAGRLCAIMGPSGAGKTTFMNTLCGKATYGKMGGSVLINGKQADVKNIKSVVGFVPQDDIVHANLTVREQIYFSARLRNRARISLQRVRLITDDVINVMQIDHIQNSIVGGTETNRGISGGQRKRVNIGLELAAQPSLLFLDEPTSGLDSTSSLSVALSLKKMGQLGMTSIMVIHQPRYSLFTLFDDVLLLGKGGQTVYIGPSQGCKKYFETLGFEMPLDENPADWFMDVICGEAPHPEDENYGVQFLFDAWEERLSTANDDDVIAPQFGREMSVKECTLVLERRVDEEWHELHGHDGLMHVEDLTDILVRCSGAMPDDKVVKEICTRMAPAGKTAVTKTNFLHYLYSLEGDVANDRILEALSPSTGCRTGRSTNAIIEEEEEEADIEGEAPVQIEVPVSPKESGGEDLLQRSTPRVCLQWIILLQRGLIQWWRNSSQRALFFVALTAGSVILAVLDRHILNTPDWSGAAFLNSHTTVALLIALYCLQPFSHDRQIFWRENSSGLSVFAFYQTKILLNSIDLIIMTFTFVAVYFIIRNASVPFFSYIVPFGLVAYAASGWGYFLGALVPPQHGPFIVSLVIFIVCGLLGGSQTLDQLLMNGPMEAIVSTLSITRWSCAMSFNYMIETNEPKPEGTVQVFTLKLEKDVYTRGLWDVGYWWTATWILVAMGTTLRVLGFFCLCVTNRDKRV